MFVDLTYAKEEGQGGHILFRFCISWETIAFYFYFFLFFLFSSLSFLSYGRH